MFGAFKFNSMQFYCSSSEFGPLPQGGETVIKLFVAIVQGDVSFVTTQELSKINNSGSKHIHSLKYQSTRPEENHLFSECCGILSRNANFS